MFTRRQSDQAWIKYLLSSGLVTIDQLELMRANQNQVDVGELLVRNSQMFDCQVWLNQALQQDRFHYIPLGTLDERELAELQELLPAIVTRCLSEGILTLGLSCQTFYLGLLRYDPEFPELNEILHSVPAELRVCLVPVSPSDYTRLHQRLRAAASH